MTTFTYEKKDYILKLLYENTSLSEIRLYVSFFENLLLKRGLKAKTKKIVQQVFIELNTIIKHNLPHSIKLSPEAVFIQSAKNLKVLVKLKIDPKQKKRDPFPFFITTEKRQVILGYKILIESVLKSDSSRNLPKKFAEEIWLSFLKESQSFEQRNELHCKIYDSRLELRRYWPRKTSRVILD